MKSNVFGTALAVCALFVCASVCNAKSWRINHDVTKGADFTSIKAAMDTTAVVDGDTLYLDPGCILQGDQTISKAITLVGTGWQFADKPYIPARFSNDLFITAKATVVGVYVQGYIYPRCSGVVIDRCYCTCVVQNDSYYTSQNVEIRSSYIDGRIIGCGETNMKTSGWKVYNTCINYNNWEHLIRDFTNITVENCLIRNTYGSSSYYIFFRVDNSLIRNNIIFRHDACKNCILYESDNNSFYNNVLSADETFTAGTNNICLNTGDIGQVVVNDGGAGGAWAQLKEGSPAIGAGEGGVDCGPFAEGSLYPFVVCGMPMYIPYFKEVSVPSQPTDGKVRVSLKIVNQNK